MSVLGLDVGTSTCKGIVLSADGAILAEEQISYADAVCISGASAEIPASCFTEHAAQVIRMLAVRTKDDPIEAIAVSSHGETLIPIGADGQALAGAMLSMDRRCAQYSDKLVSRMGQERIYSITGSMMHPQFPVPKVMWLQTEHPDLTGKVVHYDTANDHIYRMLGIPGMMDYSIASRFGGLDVNTRKWSDEIMDAAGIKEDLFSRPVCGGTPLGYIPEAIAKDLGLGNRVLAVVGGHDQPCAAIGMGVVEPGTVTVSAGSYECAVLATDKPLNDKHGMVYGLNSYCHVLPNQYVTLAFFVSGMMVKWYLDAFCSEERHIAKDLDMSVYHYMESLTDGNPTGICITPHIFGSMNPEWSEKNTAKISGLTANATKGSLYQAVLEGTCCELDLNLQVLEKMNSKVDRLLMTGGGTHSERWMQMRADITGKPIEVVSDGVEASCVGAAILAGIGANVFVDAEDANMRIKRNLKNYKPQNMDSYTGQKDAYLLLHRPGLLAD